MQEQIYRDKTAAGKEWRRWWWCVCVCGGGAFLKAGGGDISPQSRLHRGKERMPLYNFECLYSNRRSELCSPKDAAISALSHPPNQPPPPPAWIRGKDTLANPIVELGSFIKVKERWI